MSTQSRIPAVLLSEEADPSYHTPADVLPCAEMPDGEHIWTPNADEMTIRDGVPPELEEELEVLATPSGDAEYDSTKLAYVDGVRALFGL